MPFPDEGEAPERGFDDLKIQLDAGSFLLSLFSHTIIGSANDFIPSQR